MKTKYMRHINNEFDQIYISEFKICNENVNIHVRKVIYDTYI